VLGGVRERLRQGVVSGDLDAVRQPPWHVDLQLDRETGPACQRAERRFKPSLLQDRGVQALRDLSQLLDHLGQPLRRVRPVLYQRLLLLRDQGLGGPEFECDRYQPLLRPVVKVALDATASLVGGGDDPRP